MATTPPPASTVRTPPTPRLGSKHDSYEPYATRKSTRSQRTVHTPPPPLKSHSDTTSALTPPTSKRTHPKGHRHTFSPPPSVQSSPKKKNGRLSDPTSRRSVSGRLNDTATAHAASALGISPAAPSSAPFRSSDHASTTIPASGMLPTPAKTPRKRPVQAAPGVSSTARILFPSRPETVDELMPLPKKKRAKKHQGFSLDSFTDAGDAGEGDASISIFTDSKDRVPELDASEDNPFYEKKAQVANGQGRSKRPGKRGKFKGSEDVKDAFDRNEGMVYVFRGKKIYRRFEDEDNNLDSEDMQVNEGDLDVPTASARPLTRSSIKPRLLFPTEQQKRAREQKNNQPSSMQEADEEAITDIDDAAQVPLPSSDIEGSDLDDPPHLSADHAEAPSPTTPTGDALTPSSPPTARATRARVRSAALSSSPLAHAEPEDILHRGKKVSPFDGWPRTKPGTGAAGKSKKRQGEEMGPSEAAGRKRVRAEKS